MDMELCQDGVCIHASDLLVMQAKVGSKCLRTTPQEKERKAIIDQYTSTPVRLHIRTVHLI